MTDTNLEKAREWFAIHCLRLTPSGHSAVPPTADSLAAFRRDAVVEGLRMAADACLSEPMAYAEVAAKRIRSLADKMEGK